MYEEFLKNCPFCGRKEVRIYKGCRVYYIHCDCCQFESTLANNTKWLIEHWNRRPEAEKK